MGKYYKMTIDNEDNIHININKNGYGKDYRERKKDETIIKNCLIQDMKEISNYCDKLEKLIDELLEFIEDMIDEDVISNTFDMTTKEFIEYIKSKLISR